ncbi:hypothetical protein [Grimontia marina]|uniref:SGNH hydrolase-type esterase domain-containing protein n=1 Tax=Grimontia marina TaxID=646534 RepID=A0A128FJB2_9GAMM|nr:hypothetical protein [Grimontia marina]CZF86356.1 hypothetical protein GMA8713_04390 [Grimontia marina]
MRVAVIGDSVMWGQGIPRHQTYANQLVAWLSRELGIGASINDMHQPVTGDYKAHSGAIIGKKNEHHRRPAFDTHLPQPTFFGELPAAYPTITKQLTELQRPEDIDLLLVNGIANDVGLLSPVRDFEKAISSLEQRVSERLIPFLTKTRSQCPNALILYTGYFPAVSPHSNFKSIEQFTDVMHSSGSMMRQILNFKTGNRYADTAIDMAKALSPVDDVLGWLSKKLQKPDNMIERVKLDGYLFYKAMELSTMQAVDRVNRRLASTNKDPIWFIHPGLSATQSIFTRRPQVWGWNGDPTVTRERQKLCPNYQAALEYSAKNGIEVEQNLFSAVSCKNAHLLHPNKAGANQYFSRLRSMMTDHHNFSLRKVMNNIAPGYSLRKATQELGIPFYGSLRNLIPHQTLNMLGATLTVQAKTRAKKLTFHLHYSNRKFPLVVNAVTNQGAMTLFASEQVVLDLEARLPIRSLNKLSLRCATSGVSKVSNVNLQVMINGASFAFDLEDAAAALRPQGIPLPFGLNATQ